MIEPLEAASAESAFQVLWLKRGKSKGRTRTVLARVGLTIVGAAGVWLLVRGVGWPTLAGTLRRALVWMPLLLALEGARVVTDGLATLWSYGRKRTVPHGKMFLAQLIGSAAGSLTPAGRLASEAIKAALLSPWIGGVAAAAGATTSQAASLLATALISVPCTIAALSMTGLSLVSVALLAHTGVTALLGAGLRSGMRARRVLGWVKARFGRVATAAEAFEGHARALPFLPIGPVAILLVGRVLQIAQYAVLAMAVAGSISMPRSLLAQGVNMVALAVGVLIPGQIGVSDGTFALSAGAMGITVAQALSIALLAHMVQVLFVVFGAAAGLTWRTGLKTQPRSDAREAAPPAAGSWSRS